MHSHNASTMSDQTTHQHPQDTSTPSSEAWEQPDTPFTARIWVFTAKKVGAILTHAFINTFSNMLGDGYNTAHSKQHSLGLGYILAHRATTKLYALQQHVFVCWSSHTLSQHSTGWLPSVEKTALPEIQPKNAVSSTQKQQPLPKGGKKNPTELFFKLQPRGNRNISCMEKPGKLTKSSSLCEMKLPHQDLTHWNGEPISNLGEILCP